MVCIFDCLCFRNGDSCTEVLSANQFKWQISSCSNKKQFICEKPQGRTCELKLCGEEMLNYPMNLNRTDYVVRKNGKHMNIYTEPKRFVICFARTTCFTFNPLHPKQKFYCPSLIYIEKLCGFVHNFCMIFCIIF